MASDFTTAFTGGVNGTESYGERWQILVQGTWEESDTWSIEVVSPELGRATVGLGNLGGLVKSDFGTAFAYDNRLYLALRKRISFCAKGEPTHWEDQELGSENELSAGYIAYDTTVGPMDHAVGFGTLQGRLIVFGERSIKAWEVAANPADFVLKQALINVGSIAPATIQSIGDSDIIYLARNGIQSLRSLPLTLNGEVQSIGAAIERLIQSDIETDVDYDEAVGVIEPSTNQYWMTINDKTYILSRYRDEGIHAWSMGSFLYNWVEQPELDSFIPKKFLIAQDTLWVLTTLGKIVQYVPPLSALATSQNITMETHWSDCGDPRRKIAVSVDVAIQGTWTIYATMDYKANPLVWKTVATVSSSTFSPHSFRFTATGTHVKFKMEHSLLSADYARIGAIKFNYEPAGEKK